MNNDIPSQADSQVAGTDAASTTRSSRTVGVAAVVALALSAGGSDAATAQGATTATIATRSVVSASPRADYVRADLPAADAFTFTVTAPAKAVEQAAPVAEQIATAADDSCGLVRMNDDTKAGYVGDIGSFPINPEVGTTDPDQADLWQVVCLTGDGQVNEGIDLVWSKKGQLPEATAATDICVPTKLDDAGKKSYFDDKSFPIGKYVTDVTGPVETDNDLDKVDVYEVGCFKVKPPTDELATGATDVQPDEGYVSDIIWAAKGAQPGISESSLALGLPQIELQLQPAS